MPDQRAAADAVNDAERERLILEHLPQVRLIARRIQERLPENIALEDLVSTGVIGLISAIDNFARFARNATSTIVKALMCTCG